MISRVAESCFWLHRYVERADNMARLIRVNRSFVLDVKLPTAAQWRPVVVVSGEEERFIELLSESAMNDGEEVQEYLTWNERNPTSIYSCAKWARENARTIRETISLEMWENLNVFWHWMTGRPARKLYKSDRDAFYLRVRDAAALFLGASRQTVLHDEPFSFMQLGVMLERAGQTARIIDMKYHSLSPLSSGSGETPAEETVIESAQAMALLRSCSAIEPFFKRTARTPASRPVVAFLYGESLFPRSVVHCLGQANTLLADVRRAAGTEMGPISTQLLGEMLKSVQKSATSGHPAPAMHNEMTRVINGVEAICQAIHEEFFDPSFETASIPKAPTMQRQEQQ